MNTNNMFCGKTLSNETQSLKYVAALSKENIGRSEVISNPRREKSIWSKGFWVAFVNTTGNSPSVAGSTQPILYI
jgi:hypothetical protein